MAMHRSTLRHQSAAWKRNSLGFPREPQVAVLSLEDELSKLLELRERIAPSELPPEPGPTPPAEYVRRLEALEAQRPLSNGLPSPPPPAGRLQELNRIDEALKKCRRLKSQRDRDNYEGGLGIRKRREASEAECERIEAERRAALEEIDAKARAESEGVRTKAGADLQAVKEHCQRDLRAKVDKADPETKALLQEVTL